MGGIDAAGGIMLLWDNRSATVEKSWRDGFSISVLVEDLKNNTKWLLTSVLSIQAQSHRPI